MQRFRYEWNEIHPDPARILPMLIRDSESGELRIFPEVLCSVRSNK